MTVQVVLQSFSTHTSIKLYAYLEFSAMQWHFDSYFFCCYKDVYFWKLISYKQFIGSQGPKKIWWIATGTFIFKKKSSSRSFWFFGDDIKQASNYAFHLDLQADEKNQDCSEMKWNFIKSKEKEVCIYFKKTLYDMLIYI